MTRPLRAVVLGGGLSGLAAALGLARAGHQVTVLEAAPQPGGLAGSFERDGHSYPLGYHHILPRDRTLLRFLGRIGAADRVSWRRVRMLFRVDGRLLDLGRLPDFLRFPMRPLDKLRFVRLMLRAFAKRDWNDWTGRSGQELVDGWGGPGVREAIFEPLSQLKFELPCSEVSGAWLGARLHYREGSDALGYIPGANWTQVLCEGVAALAQEAGVGLRLSTPVTALEQDGGRLTAARADGGERFAGDLFVSTLPPERLLSMVADTSEELRGIRFTALISVVCATRQQLPDFYWMNLLSPRLHACGIFQLSALNPTIGALGETCVNFVTHLSNSRRSLFQLDADALMACYREDFRAVFGFDLEARWVKITRIAQYSPVLVPGYRNPPPRSRSLANLYLAGNYCTFPSIVSTGTALASGVTTAQAVLRDHGQEAGAAAIADLLASP